MPVAFAPHIERLEGYVPGEQPKDGVLIKLNTNENPYPPSPMVAEAIREALDDRLRLYPDPTASGFRGAVADLHDVDPAMVLVGNGSDDLLTILTRAFAAPGDVVAYPTPSYVLYRTLAEIQGSRPVEVPFNDDWSIDPDAFAADRPKLALLANPNSPSGTWLPPERVAPIAARLECPLVIDEAYVDFSEGDCLGLIESHPNAIITRTLSKGYGLAGLRIGYLIARPEVVEGLVKVKDSYNCDRLSLVGGAAAIRDRADHDRKRAQILSTRGRLVTAMRELGYRVPETHANFAWCEGGPPASEVFVALRERGILVRLMRYPGRPDGLRITVGDDPQIDALIAAMRSIVG